MKNLILLLLLMVIILNACSLNQAASNSPLKFDQRYTKCEQKWVAFVDKELDNYFNYGYIYIDEQTGYTIDIKGVFHINLFNKYIVDTTIAVNTPLKYKLKPDWPKFAVIPLDRFEELDLPAKPYWVKKYYSYTDTAQHNYKIGFYYNDADEFSIALTYLKKAYALKPHPPGVEFELAFAYNSLKQYDNAIAVLLPAIQNKLPDASYYKELGFAYSSKHEYSNAISAYKKGLEFYNDNKPSDFKSEMAENLANAYKRIGKMEDYMIWMVKAKEYTPAHKDSNKPIKKGLF